MKLFITNYLDAKKNAWSESTKKSERARLNVVADHLNNEPLVLWKFLEQNQTERYTIVTTWTRVANFWDWLKAEGHVDGEVNPYRKWRSDNAGFFKNAYVPHFPNLSFKDAKKQIASMSDEAARKKAEAHLHSGLRLIDSVDIRDGKVMAGKGGKVRRLFANLSKKEFAYDKSDATFRRRLAEVGLSPHDLRKLFASVLVKKGLNKWDLTRVMGWSSSKTADRYIAALTEDELAAFVKKATR